MGDASENGRRQAGIPPAHAVAAFRRLCDIGIDPPAQIPPTIFEAALHTFLACQRLDMKSLAPQLGMSRATLYRKVGDRDRLLGEVLWYLTRIAIARSLTPEPDGSGVEVVGVVINRFLRDISGQLPFQRLLRNEPEIALRILTSKHGPVQGGIVSVVERLVTEVAERNGLRINIAVPTLAYAVVRIGESFLYSDVIAGHPADLDQAVEVISALLRGSTSVSGSVGRLTAE